MLKLPGILREKEFNKSSLLKKRYIEINSWVMIHLIILELVTTQEKLRVSFLMVTVLQ